MRLLLPRVERFITMNEIKKNKVKILHVINGMGSGGAEMDIMNWYRNINRDNIQFDFLIRSHQVFYEEEILELGGNVYQSASFPRHIIKNFIETWKFFLENSKKYNAIHVHGNALVYILPLVLAKIFKIPVRIMHIHNTSANSKLSDLVHRFNRFFISRFTTKKIACSNAAGEFGFKNNFIVVNNGIDIAQYQLDKESIKKSMNQEFGLSEDTMILGHIGRFLVSKNHDFILDCYKEICKQRKVALFLVGEGPLMDKIKRRIENEHIKNVFMLGQRKDVPQLLNYFDVLIFPSLYEGVPLVPLEAQAAGVNVICSDVITDDVCITSQIQKMSLSCSEKEWANVILGNLDNEAREDICKDFVQKKYDIGSNVELLMKIWCGN